jgi:glycosyltransferase involved in cell wall biosynthesis
VSGSPNCARPLRVAAFTGGKSVPSARFRVRQYIEPLDRLGIAVQERWPSLGAYPPRQQWLRPPWLLGTIAERIPDIVGGWRDDITFLQREMVSTLPLLEGLTRRPRLLDVDDAVHLFRGGWVARRLAGVADMVVVGNAWLAEAWRRWSTSVEILPTAVDTARYTVSPLPECPIIGWIGTSGNLRHVERIAPALEQVCRRFPQLTIAICSDRCPDLFGLPVSHVPWRADVEPAFLSSLTVGIMPLEDSPWERGKCSFKMLQYMAAGRPCVVSPVGMNNEILSQGQVGMTATTIPQWVEALSTLVADRATAEDMGATGRKLAVDRYSLSVLAPKFAELIRRVS